LYIKIDKLLPAILAPLNLVPLFQFGDDFEMRQDKKERKNRQKSRRNFKKDGETYESG